MKLIQLSQEKIYDIENGIMYLNVAGIVSIDNPRHAVEDEYFAILTASESEVLWSVLQTFSKSVKL